MAGYRDVIVASLETPIVGADDMTEDEMIRRILAHTPTDTANDLIAALESAGHCIVPMEPTDAMADAAIRDTNHGMPRPTYRAMLSARPRD